MERAIAVIEDEETIAAALAARLRKEGFRVETAHDGPSGVALCERMAPDLVVLDVMLPGFDGIEVCRRIQQDRPVPVVMLTARDSETDMLVGLGVGADDYITKPFSPRELVARVQVVLRRVDRSAAPPPDGLLTVADLTVDQAARRVRRSGEPRPGARSTAARAPSGGITGLGLLLRGYPRSRRPKAGTCADLITDSVEGKYRRRVGAPPLAPDPAVGVDGRATAAQ